MADIGQMTQQMRQRLKPSGVNTTPVAARGGAADDGCPLCKGAGYLVDGSADPARPTLVRCDCMAGTDRRNRYMRARMLSDLIDADDLTFQTFKQGRQAEALTAARTFCQTPRGILLLVGGPGTGKTHLLCAIANQLLSGGHSGRWPIYCVVPNLLNRLRVAYSANTPTLVDDVAAYEAKLAEADVLLLDDLGAENETAWTNERLFSIIDDRCRRQRPMVIASNLVPTALPPRLASRLTDRGRSVVVVMQAGDYRQSKERASGGS